MILSETNKVQRTVIPEKLKGLKKIRFKDYRRYRPEYISALSLVDSCSAAADRMPLEIPLTTKFEVSELLKEIGFPEYQEAIKKNHIDGNAMALLEADKLPKMNIKNFEKIKKLMSAIRKLYHIDQKEHKRYINLPFGHPGTLYLFYKCSRTGHIISTMSHSDYYRRIQIIREETTADQRYYALLNHWNRIEPYREWGPHIIIGCTQRYNPMTGTTMRQNFHPKQHPYLLKPLSLYSLCPLLNAGSQ